jgi:hypothetical protein
MNVPPTAYAGLDQTLTDSDESGSESVTLDGSASSDSDGSIVSYVWTLDGVEIATGATPTVDLAVGVHTITLTVTGDGATGSDEVIGEMQYEDSLSIGLHPRARRNHCRIIPAAQP